MELVKKVTPETKCHKIPKKLCSPVGCGFVQGPEECHNKKETIVQEVNLNLNTNNYKWDVQHWGFRSLF
jgi:hypothetical protein